MEQPHIERTFEESHALSPYWTLRGCEIPGYHIVSETILNFIQNISGNSTDPYDDLFKNPDAMFDALNLIYQILEQARKEGVIVAKFDTMDNEEKRYVIHKIVPVKFEPTSRTSDEKEVQS